MLTPTSFSELTMFSTTRLVTYPEKDKKQRVGTCFFYTCKFGDDDLNELILLVTAGHVTVDEEKVIITVRRSLDDDGKIPSDNSVDIIIENVSNNWILHPDALTDISALVFNEYIEKYRAMGMPLYLVAITDEYIPEQEELEKLNALEEVIMVGYPHGLWDNENHLPIMLKGITATHPSIDFNKLPKAAIDISCYKGSSGSPVMIINEGYYAQKTGPTTIGSRAILLGIFTGAAKIGERESDETMHIGYYIKAKELKHLAQLIASKSAPQ